MSALPNCFKTDLFRKKLTSEILNSLWIMPYQSHCFALGTAEIRSMRQASKCLHEVKDVSHSSTTVMRGTKQVLPVPRYLMGLRGGMDLQIQGKDSSSGWPGFFWTFSTTTMQGDKRKQGYLGVAAQFCPSQRHQRKCRQTPAAAGLKCFLKMR